MLKIVYSTIYALFVLSFFPILSVAYGFMNNGATGAHVFFGAFVWIVSVAILVVGGYKLINYLNN